MIVKQCNWSARCCHLTWTRLPIFTKQKTFSLFVEMSTKIFFFNQGQKFPWNSFTQFSRVSSSLQTCNPSFYLFITTTKIMSQRKTFDCQRRTSCQVKKWPAWASYSLESSVKCLWRYKHRDDVTGKFDRVSLEKLKEHHVTQVRAW